MSLTSLDPTQAFAEGLAKGRGFAQLSRQQNTRVSLVVYVASAYSSLSFVEIVVGTLVLAATYAAVVAFNDAQDLEIDVANARRQLPLVSGELKKSDAVMFSLALSVLIVTWLAFIDRFETMAVVVALLAFGFAYSHPSLRISDRGYAATILLAIAYIGGPLALAYSQKAALPSAVTMLGLVVCAAGVILHKDFRDEIGDRAFGKRTPLVRHGSSHVRVVSLCLIVGGLVLVARTDTGLWLLPGSALVGLVVAMLVRHSSNRSLLFGMRASYLLTIAMILL